MSADDPLRRRKCRKLSAKLDPLGAAAEDSDALDGDGLFYCSNGQMRDWATVKLTPLEEQVVAIKRLHPDVLLLVEVGYKYRFFGPPPPPPPLPPLPIRARVRPYMPTVPSQRYGSAEECVGVCV